MYLGVPKHKTFLNPSFLMVDTKNSVAWLENRNCCKETKRQMI